MILIEIKSTDQSFPDHASHLRKFYSDFEEPVCLVVSRDKIRRKEGWITFLHWKDALDEIFPERLSSNLYML